MHPYEQRRTFAIISHPDAGKTTLTEKLLLYGGAIHLAGSVRARKNQRAATSDWMDLEKKRGISVTSSVMHFEHNGIHFNLLDTPGHQDFSEDTYRTLIAADCAIMLLDAAKGVEAQTKKLFHVCRMRGTPVVTFINKLDRPARDAFSLLAEVEKVLGLNTVPFTWPIGSGDAFQGVFDRAKQSILRFERSQQNATRVAAVEAKLGSTEMRTLIGEQATQSLEEEVALLEEAGDRFELEKFLKGEQSPVFFGSALTNFGVEPFLEAFADLCPKPSRRESAQGEIRPDSKEFTAFVFKVQANMDPSHRDRIAFLRICSGEFEGGMRVHHYRLGKEIRLARAEQFMAQARTGVDHAYAGDIVGLYDTGIFRIGDTLSTGKPVHFSSVPRFSPEHFARLRLKDPMKRKQFQLGVDQLSEEGTTQIFTQPGFEKDPILGVVGRLQFDVLMYRLEHEYGAPVELEMLPYGSARWVKLADGTSTPTLKDLEMRRMPLAVWDQDQQPVALFRDEWEVRRASNDNPSWSFLETAPI